MQYIWKKHAACTQAASLRPSNSLIFTFQVTYSNISVCAKSSAETQWKGAAAGVLSCTAHTALGRIHLPCLNPGMERALG